jgi:phosphoadenosine phosphosulfate reductase
MIDKEIELLGKLRGWSHRLPAAAAMINRAMDIPGRWCVSFSGGKDSTVMLDIALYIKPDLDIVWFDDGWDYPETMDYLVQTENRLSKSIIRVPYPLKAKFWKNSYGGDDPAYDHVGNMSYANWRSAYCGSLIGMRKQESTQRLFTLAKTALYYAKSDQQWHCSPLADWSTEDIWGYIGANHIPYNQVYRKLYDLGIPLAQSRVGPLTAWMVYQYGAIAILKRGWPELYNRFAARFPEAGQYT